MISAVHNLNLNSIENLLFMGDIHGNFETLNSKIHKIDNSLIIVCGDIGMGFNNPIYYRGVFEKLQHLCYRNNNYICFIRGNHDDPRYFKYQFCEKINSDLVDLYDRVYLLEDYTLIHTEFGNILTIGGGISIDRKQRSIGTSYWPDEQVKTMSIKDFNSLVEYDVDIIATHTAPNFCNPIGVNSTIVDQFAERDKTLKDELIQERQLMDDLYSLIRENWGIKEWYYGHFHESYYLMNEDNIKFFGLDCFEIKQSNIIY